ncbi:hypothetical protein QFC21_006996 [Naganishia friedmannii]|uniref:Uncharacterized protein n=1 Tax=Naganishia friedmannii TaxID=89922 RepID=A0ACC2UZ38_9TREE|nr:hypothetical protein QFC21_006996 [Naganishia friedmannii]
MARQAHTAITKPSSELSTEFANKHITPGIGRVASDLIIERGKGSWVWTTDGRKWLDFTSGIGVTCLGHAHPAITAAVTAQLEKIVHSQVNIAHSEAYVRLVERLLPLMPDPSLDTFFFTNSGSEAVENAVKVAKNYNNRRGIVVMQGSYHGRTYATSAMTTSKTVYSAGFGTSIAGIYPTPFPYASQLHMPADTPTEDLTKLALSHLSLLFKQQIPASEVSCIILEPVLGEGGYVPAPADFLKALREICDREGILLVFDEVQCGFGRTGKMFYSEYSGVVPDIQIMAKGIAGGMPLSAIVAKNEFMKNQKPGSMGGTYSGNALACAASAAIMDVFEQENILDNVNARSAQLFETLHALRDGEETKHLIKDVRGKGLMVGLEFEPFVEPVTASSIISGTATGATKPTAGASSAPQHGQKQRVKDIGSRVAKKCLEKGMLILTTSVFDVIRFIPALNVTEGETAEACRIFRESVEEVAREG